MCSAIAGGEKTIPALFSALRVFLAFLDFRVEAFGHLPTLTATVPLATALASAGTG